MNRQKNKLPKPSATVDNRQPLEPPALPKPNKPRLVVTGLLLAAWMSFLVVLALAG